MRRLRTINTHPQVPRRWREHRQQKRGVIYIVAEPVQPLCEVIEALQAPGGIAWGIYTLAAAVKFLNMDASCIHGQVCMTSIFVDRGMDWKLGGFEFLIGTAELDDGYVNNLKEMLPKRYQSPELARGNVSALKQIPVAADWWALGCTLFEIFCGPIRSPADLKNIQTMPEALRPDYIGC